MPMLIGVLVVMAMMYQLFFRYDTWSSDEKPDVRYEHDNLTGETRVLKPGARTSVFARIIGSGDGGERETEGRFLEPLEEVPVVESPAVETASLASSSGLQSSAELNPADIDLKNPVHLEKVARPVPVPREVVVASSAPPVPGGNIASDRGNGPFAVRQIDLDQDGVNEEIIQNAEQSDGLLDISIVKNGREIFFGRGQQISLLPTRNRGWADIALKMGTQTLQVFRYDIRSSAYRALNEHS
ncbi:hypothetical protein [Vampirovibrio sp.]|uniref:hypothetical protein n=1 Tax=Vampirovibrio sp. TaxID=2717857 RepID=UPI0035932CA7